MVKVFIERKNRTEELNAETVIELLKKLNINPETVLITRDNDLLNLNDKLQKKDNIKLLNVISGGWKIFNYLIVMYFSLIQNM